MTWLLDEGSVACGVEGRNILVVFVWEDVLGRGSGSDQSSRGRRRKKIRERERLEIESVGQRQNSSVWSVSRESGGRRRHVCPLTTARVSVMFCAYSYYKSLMCVPSKTYCSRVSHSSIEEDSNFLVFNICMFETIVWTVREQVF